MRRLPAVKRRRKAARRRSNSFSRCLKLDGRDTCPGRFVFVWAPQRDAWTCSAGRRGASWVFRFVGGRILPPGSRFARPSPQAVAPLADSLRSRLFRALPHILFVRHNARSCGGPGDSGNPRMRSAEPSPLVPRRTPDLRRTFPTGSASNRDAGTKPHDANRRYAPDDKSTTSLVRPMSNSSPWTSSCSPRIRTKTPVLDARSVNTTVPACSSMMQCC
jgi:hypothetical protein